MVIHAFMVDTNIDGAMPIKCDLKLEDDNLIISLVPLKLDLVIAKNDIDLVLNEDLHG